MAVPSRKPAAPARIPSGGSKKKVPRTRKTRAGNGKSPAKGKVDEPAPPAARFARAVDEIARQLFRAYRRVEISPESVIAEASARGLHVTSLEQLRALPLTKREALATTYIKSAKIWATSHGTTLGAAGAVTMAADIATLVALNLRMIQQVSLAYGVSPAPERVDAWALMLFALGETLDLREVRAIPPEKAEAATTELISETAAIFASRLLRIGPTAGRSVPLVGAVFGGLSNYAFTAEVGSRAREYFRSLAP